MPLVFAHEILRQYDIILNGIRFSFFLYFSRLPFMVNHRAYIFSTGVHLTYIF